MSRSLSLKIAALRDQFAYHPFLGLSRSCDMQTLGVCLSCFFLFVIDLEGVTAVFKPCGLTDASCVFVS